jgi:hypothetical protein
MAERNSTSSDATRGTERGSTASAAGGAGSGIQPNRTQSATASQSTSVSGAGSSAGTGSTGAGQIAGRQSDEGSSLVNKVRERASAQLTSQKDRALEGLGGVAEAVRKSTHTLREQQHDTLAGYIDQAADQIERFSQNLKNKDVGELVNDAQRLARRQPALFVGSAFALGLLGARFFKSSSPDRYRREYDYYGGYGDSGRASGRGTYGSDWRRGSPSTDTASSGATYPSPERY